MKIPSSFEQPCAAAVYIPCTNLVAAEGHLSSDMVERLKFVVAVPAVNGRGCCDGAPVLEPPQQQRFIDEF